MTPTDIVLYETSWCPYCVRVRNVLDRLGLAFTSVEVPDSHSQRTELRERFGETGVPTMTDGDVAIVDDDDAIIAYLEKTYGSPARSI